MLAVAPALAQPRSPVIPTPGRPPVSGRAKVDLAQNAVPDREEHLQRWMESHGSMSLAEQQRALQNEPGFRELPAPVQANRLKMLERLYNMNPQQRDRILDRTETLERLAPAQRQQWREAVQRLNALPEPRKHLMATTLLQLRELPPPQREAALNSPSSAAQFSPQERQTLRTLLMGEPYPPVRTPARPQSAPPPPPQ